MQKRGFAAAVAANQTDAFAGLHGQRGTVKQRLQAESQLGIE